MEIWRDIPGYGGKYQASSLGRIKRGAGIVMRMHYGKRRKFEVPEIILSQHHTKFGYLRLSIKDVTVSAHRLIAMAFIKNPKKLPQVNHIDGNKTNNQPTNLEWVDSQRNMDHAVKMGLVLNGPDHPASKITQTCINHIIDMKFRGLNSKQIGKYFSIPHGTVRGVLVRSGHGRKNLLPLNGRLDCT